MKNVEVGMLADIVNGTVVQLPGRRFPGIVIQGDSLMVLVDSVERVQVAVGRGAASEALDELAELKLLLSQYRSAYEGALLAEGVELPYTRRNT